MDGLCVPDCPDPRFFSFMMRSCCLRAARGCKLPAPNDQGITAKEVVLCFQHSERGSRDVTSVFMRLFLRIPGRDGETFSFGFVLDLQGSNMARMHVVAERAKKGSHDKTSHRFSIGQVRIDSANNYV